MSGGVERIGDATLILGDWRDALDAVGHVDLVATDPPYGTGGWRRTETGAGSNPAAKLIREEWDDGALDWLAALPPVPVLTFWPSANTGALLAAAAASGRTKHRALYMRKLDPKPQPAGRTAWSVEPIWALSAEGFQLYGGTDWFECSTPRLGRDAVATGHPYEKPLACVRWLLSKVPVAGTVLDPFCGSGTTGVAALSLGRRFVGVERDERWFTVAVRRLEAAARQADLFHDAPVSDAAAPCRKPSPDLFGVAS